MIDTVIAFALGFFFGSIAGVFLISLCAAASTGESIHSENDPCNGCFGASMGDCDKCPIKTKKG